MAWRAAVITFPGSNCDRDMAVALAMAVAELDRRPPRRPTRGYSAVIGNRAPRESPLILRRGVGEIRPAADGQMQAELGRALGQ